MLVRDAVESDLDAIFEILNHEILTGVNTFKLDPLLADQQQAWWKLHVADRYPVLAAVDESSTMFGWASLSPWALHVGGYHRTSEVSIWIAEPFRGRGVGKELFAALIPRARQIGFRVLLSKVEASNQASLKLHYRFGFRDVGIMHGVGDKLDRQLDVAILERDLSQVE
ncbi:N-acyltransferase YncA [Rosistilla carotiformis]|uniref:N-acyltransferase YncA n=1 Tax=Rosistilla carotiformis TaxID=2528017 RepID=A0A518JWE7_9BACT|nr:GNAT family N-acetyltransferase [Rosistilla carotiformis]QDV69868.1 N-acyltransferase YncA [Rosistilla carotiformis]